MIQFTGPAPRSEGDQYDGGRMSDSPIKVRWLCDLPVHRDALLVGTKVGTADKSSRTVIHFQGGTDMSATKLWVIIMMATFFLILGTSLGVSQEVVIQPGDTVTVRVISPPLPPPEIIEVPVIELDTVYACPLDFTRTDDGDSWTCAAPTDPDTIPPIVVDSTPPLAVSGLVLTIDGTDLLVEWNDRPSPDRGGVRTTGYYVAHGFQEPGHEPEPTVDVDGTPYRIALVGFGERWVCVTAHNDLPAESSCKPVDYDAPPIPTSAYLLSVAPEPYSMSGITTVVEGSYSIHLDRVDGAWQGIGDVTVAGVDSVVMCSGGVCNREQRLPYELGGDNIDLTLGSYEVTWEVFGTDPDSGSALVTVTAAVGDALGQACGWGDARCTIVGDELIITMEEGRRGQLYATMEFEGDPRIFAVLPNNYVEARYDAERGWICLIGGGEIIPVEGTETNFAAGSLWQPPPACPPQSVDA